MDKSRRKGFESARVIKGECNYRGNISTVSVVFSHISLITFRKHHGKDESLDLLWL